MKAFVVAGALLREAASRKWFLALGIGVTLVLGVLGSALRLDVVDGALAATKLFGGDLNVGIQSADVALRPVFTAASYVLFYGGTAFGVMACADFGPALLSPGRIEHLLSQPIRRWELLAGTYLGVALLATLAAAYGAGGLALILGIKTGVWNLRPLVAGALASFSFATIYSVMLAASVFVRSAAFSGFAGAVLFLLGAVSGYRESIAKAFGDGLGRTVFELAMLPLPRISTLADVAGNIAGSRGLSEDFSLFRLLAGMMVFALGAISVAVWQFERKDF